MTVRTFWQHRDISVFFASALIALVTSLYTSISAGTERPRLIGIKVEQFFCFIGLAENILRERAIHYTVAFHRCPEPATAQDRLDAREFQNFWPEIQYSESEADEREEMIEQAVEAPTPNGLFTRSEIECLIEKRNDLMQVDGIVIIEYPIC